VLWSAQPGSTAMDPPRLSLDRFLGNIGVWFGASALQAASPKSCTRGESLANVENFDEVWVNSQVQRYASCPEQESHAPTAQEIAQLPGGGRYDGLLSIGRSSELLQQLADVFRDDPPVKCGSDRELVGLSCAYGGRYKTEVFSPAAVAKHLQLCYAFWTVSVTENVQQLVLPQTSRLIIVGDLHGQLEDLLWIFLKYGAPSNANQYLFNGDIVDRGGHSIEILLLLFAIKRDIPSAIHIQRGNHEDMHVNLQFGFRAELQSKFQDHFGVLWNICNHIVFPLMPLATVVHAVLTGGRRFCVLHGGIPVDCPGQAGPVSLADDIGRAARVRPTLQCNRDLTDHILFNLVWADPADSIQGKMKGSEVGRGNRFVESETIEFCEANGLAFIVRSHEVPRNLRGAAATHGGKTYTVFSASNYMGSAGNRGGVFICEANKGLQLNEHWAPPWRELAEMYRCGFPPGSPDAVKLVKKWEARYNIGTHEEANATSPSASTESSPRTAAVNPVEAAADDQLRQFVIERICENKDTLFKAFCEIDTASTGLVPKAVWAETMLKQLGPLCSQVLTAPLLERLAVRWELRDPVGYVRFLHRFQIRGYVENNGSGDQPDLLRQVSFVRKQLLDAPYTHLDKLLDPDGDRSVSPKEFNALLPMFGVDVTPLQAGVLYEMMCNFRQQNPLTLDACILCLAIMSRDPAPVNCWSSVAEKISSAMVDAGQSSAYLFRLWDRDRDGYLSLSELRVGLEQLPSTQGLPAAGVAAFMRYIEGMGVTNNRISILEFVRALAPPDWAMFLHSSLLKDLLKRVWICRPALHALLAKNDPRGTNRATLLVFREGMEEINGQLEARGRPRLSSMQVDAICEIAAKGRKWVPYDEFIQGLHVVDTGAGG